MVISVLSRRTAIRDADEWEKRASRLRERLGAFLQRQPGFGGLELRREGEGGLVEETRWDSAEDCRRYVRGGAAAMAATIADALLPTAPYPNGTWQREMRDD